MLGKRELYQQIDLLRIDPALMTRLDGRPRKAAAAENLSPLHGEVDLGTARIAGDRLELRAEHVVEDRRELVCVVTDAIGADHRLLPARILQGRHARRMPGDADADLVVGAA